MPALPMLDEMDGGRWCVSTAASAPAHGGVPFPTGWEHGWIMDAQRDGITPGVRADAIDDLIIHPGFTASCPAKREPQLLFLPAGQPRGFPGRLI
jgi:hypothetical protein